MENVQCMVKFLWWANLMPYVNNCYRKLMCGQSRDLVYFFMHIGNEERC